MQRLLLLLTLFLLATPGLAAQDDLTTDLPFFQKKARLYQRWLDTKKLGPLLSVDSIHLAKNGHELEFFLKLNELDPDFAAGVWRGLKESFQPSPGAPTLESGLFNTFVRFMEVDPAYANVQIYIPQSAEPNAPYSPCFYVWVYEEDGRSVVNDRIENCKAQTVDIEVPIPAFNTAAGTSISRINHKAAATNIFAAIQAFARQKYEVNKPDCDGRSPIVLPPEKLTDYYLEFYVEDLCQEVLVDEKQSLWCDFVELWWGDCNDTRRERLEFRINLNRGDNHFNLNIEITGKFGSGIYKPRTGWMDMEPDFEEAFLKPYAKLFQAELQDYLLEVRP